VPLSNGFLPLCQLDLHKINFITVQKRFFFSISPFYPCFVGMQISRPYTVVLPSLQVDPSEREYDGKRFHLMIKLYPDGTLTPTLNAVTAGELSENLFSVQPLLFSYNIELQFVLFNWILMFNY